WQLNKGWPTMLWDLYNYDYDEAGAYFGAKKANEDLHVLYAYDTGTVTVDNLTGVNQPGLSVQSRVYDLSGQVLDRQTASDLSVTPQGVQNNVLTPHVPAATTPPAPAKTYFIELTLRQHGVVVDRNVYWMSTQQDVINWDSTEGNPQANNGAPLSQYADMTALQNLPSEPVQVAAASSPAPGGKLVTSITITNPSSNSAVAFFLRADVRRGTAAGTALPGDNEVRPVDWSDNDITLWPGQSQTLTATYDAAALSGATPVVSVSGWNVPSSVVAAPQSGPARAAVSRAQRASGVSFFGIANGTPLTTGTPRAGTGAAPRAVAAKVTSARSAPAGGSSRAPKRPVAGPRWTITSVAHSPDTTPATSFTQGDSADTYTLTVTNTGRTATDGSTPVTLTDVVDPNISMVSISGSGWTCDTSNDPTEVCTETGGPGGGPAVLQPGQSYPPLTLTVSVPQTAGFGSQDSTAGLHVTNAVTVTGGAPAAPSTSTASETPITGPPDLTADNAVASAFRQGDSGDRYQITVINQGAGPTSGSTSAPVTATITALPAGVSVQALYGSGWTCNTAAVTSPVSEPADTCYRSDVLAGENGEEPPITVVASVAGNAAASGNETVQVSGGGDGAAPALVSAATVIAPAPSSPASGGSADLSVTSTHPGGFGQGDSADTYTLTVSNAAAAAATSGPVTVTDTLPAGITPAELTGQGWTCSLAPAQLPGTPNLFEPQLSCARSDPLAPGAAYPPITLTAAVADNTQPSVTNTAAVSGGGSAAATGTDPTTVSQLPALAVTGIDTSGGIPYAPFAQGDDRGAGDAYDITVANDGYAATTGPVTLTATLPAGLTALSMSGSGWSCRAATLTCTLTGGPLAAGASSQITLAVAVAGDAPQSVPVFFQASGGGQLPAAELDTGNLYSTVTNGGADVIQTAITPR
ncbi:MAG TPA: hypothetical protein VHU92_13085, partial [Streptosporangiaceae bacterium]|nr:hypothetical protein [Streptosporangiaceae bacterium]